MLWSLSDGARLPYGEEISLHLYTGEDVEILYSLNGAAPALYAGPIRLPLLLPGPMMDSCTVLYYAAGVPEAAESFTLYGDMDALGLPEISLTPAGESIFLLWENPIMNGTLHFSVRWDDGPPGEWTSTGLFAALERPADAQTLYVYAYVTDGKTGSSAVVLFVKARED